MTPTTLRSCASVAEQLASAPGTSTLDVAWCIGRLREVDPGLDYDTARRVLAANFEPRRTADEAARGAWLASRSDAPREGRADRVSPARLESVVSWRGKVAMRRNRATGAFEALRVFRFEEELFG